MSDTAKAPTLTQQAWRALIAIEKGIAVALLVLILLLMLAQVLARFVFQSPFFWTGELARYSYVWLSFIGAVYVMADRSHITVRLRDRTMKPRSRLLLDAFALIAVTVTCIMLLVGSFEMLVDRAGGSSPALGIPKSLFYGIVYASFVAIALHAIGSFVALVGDYRTGRIDTKSERTLRETAL